MNKEVITPKMRLGAKMQAEHAVAVSLDTREAMDAFVAKWEPEFKLALETVLGSIVGKTEKEAFLISKENGFELFVRSVDARGKVGKAPQGRIVATVISGMVTEAATEGDPFSNMFYRGYQGRL